MSNSINQALAVYRLTDPLLDLQSKPSYILERSANTSDLREEPTTQFNKTSITYTYLPSSSRVVIGKNIRTKTQMRFTFTGQDQGSPLLQLGSNSGFRMLNYGVNTATLKVDNFKTSYLESDVFPLLHRYITTKELNQEMGYTFNTPDLLFNFDDYLTEGFGYNVNSNYTEQGASSDNLHGRYMKSVIEVISNTNTEAVVDVTFISPIMLKPCSWKNNDHLTKGLFGVEKFTYIQQFKSNLEDFVFCNGAAGNVIDNIDYEIRGNPSLLIQEYELQPDMALPSNIVSYPYEDYSSQITNLSGSVASGATTTLKANSIQTGGTPSYFAFYIREQDRDRSFINPITAARINSLRILFDTKKPLTGASSSQLYEIAKKNGYSLTFEDFAYRSGGYMVCKVPTDINLDSLDAVGRTMRHSFSVEVNFTNQTNREINYELVIFYTYVGALQKSFNYASSQVNIVSADDILNSDKLPEAPRDMLLLDRKGGISVSSMFNRARKTMPKLMNFSKKCGPDMIDILKDLKGSGINGIDGLVGGKKANRSSMRDRLSEY